MSAYNEKIQKGFKNSSYTGSFDAKDKSVGTGMIGSPACGDVLKLQLKVENDIIQDVRFKTFGCGSAIASSDLAAQLLVGKSIAQALQIKDKDIAVALGLPRLKYHCSVLAAAAIKEAINDYKSKSAYSGKEKKTEGPLCKFTSRAIQRIKKILENKQDALGIKLGIKPQGCAGFGYSLQYVTQHSESDRLLHIEGIKVFVDDFSIPIIHGTEVDYNDEDLLYPGFVFVNPNEKKSCGCGFSFGV